MAEIGPNLYFTGIIRDITEYKEMEDRVLHTERLAAVGNTMTHIAHEIKNPLLIIGGGGPAEPLKLPGLDDKGRPKLSMIAGEVTPGRDGGRDAAVCAPPAGPETPGRLRAPIPAALELFQDTFADNIQGAPGGGDAGAGHEFRRQPGDQVLINLLKNALEAMPGGGDITITTTGRGANVEISVADTGVGMAPEVAANLFQPYFTTKAKGTGLGLAICRSIIQAAPGGATSVDTAPGRGAA